MVTKPLHGQFVHPFVHSKCSTYVINAAFYSCQTLSFVFRSFPELTCTLIFMLVAFYGHPCMLKLYSVVKIILCRKCASFNLNLTLI